MLRCSGSRCGGGGGIGGGRRYRRIPYESDHGTSIQSNRYIIDHEMIQGGSTSRWMYCCGGVMIMVGILMGGMMRLLVFW